jgi:DNA-binding transcriptional regulator YiaG
MDKCDNCGGELAVNVSTREAPYCYTESGLRNAWLIGVDVYRCKQCDGETAAIPRITELHTLLAEGILRAHKPLTGFEFRYIRKRASLGLPELSNRSGIVRRVVAAFEMHAGEYDKGVKVVCEFADNAWSLPPDAEEG